MATGETGFDDVTFDLISLQCHSLKSGHDYGQYVRDMSFPDNCRDRPRTGPATR
jgi:hypothetical protein